MQVPGTRTWTLSLALLIGAYAAPARAELPAESPVVEHALVPPLRDRDQLVALWRVRARAAEEGDTSRADALISELVAHRRDGGYARLDPFAFAMVREARAQWVKGDHVRALTLLEQARALAPGLPDIEDAESERVLDETPWAVHRWFLAEAASLRLRLADFHRRSLWLADATLVGGALVVLLALALMAAQAGRYALAVAHGFARALPLLNPWVALFTLGVALVTPLALGFGPALLLFPLAIILWPLQNTGERCVSIAFVVLLGAVPWTLRAVDRLSEAGTGVSQALHALSVDPGDARAAEVVSGALARNPEDWQAAAALGMAEKRLGHLDSAIGLLEQGLKSVPAGSQESGFVMNNLANARFASGRSERAVTLYREAAALLPGRAEPLFNLSRLYTRTGQLEQSKVEFNRALALETARVSGWSDDTDLNLNRYVVDMPLEASGLLKREVDALFAPSPLAARAWLRLAGPVPEAVAPALACAALIAFAVLSASAGRRKVVLACPRCGRGAEKRATSTESAPLCEQCHSLFVRNLPVDRRVRFDKDEEIARYRTARTWSLGLGGALMPGFGSALQGHPGRAMLPLALGLALLAYILLPRGLLADPSPTHAAMSPITAVAVGAFAVMWVVNLFAVVRARRAVN